MRVRCVKIFSPSDGRQVEYHPSVRIGEVYDVVSILCTAGKDPLLQIFNKDSPSLWPSRMFTVVSSKPKANWQIGINDIGTVEFGPAKFQEPGYWELFFEEDPDALRIFEEEFLRYRSV